MAFLMKFEGLFNCGLFIHKTLTYNCVFDLWGFIFILV